MKELTERDIRKIIKEVSGSVALTGEAICGYYSEGRYYLTKNKEEVAYYQKRAEHLLSKASPLMEIYRQDRERDYNTFLQTDSQAEGHRQKSEIMLSCSGKWQMNFTAW